MTFIHPLLLGGLLLAGIPVLIHLIMRQKPKRLLFPAFQFLLLKHRTNQRSLRLRHLLLLALRIALIVAMCLALARPLVKGFLPRGEQPAAVVLLIDTSYSMEYTVAGRTRLDEAKEHALEILKDLPDGSRVAVLDSAEDGGEESRTLDQARQRIGELKLHYANKPLNQQIVQAYGLYGELEKDPTNPDEPLPRFLYIFSDRTTACWDLGAASNQKPPDGLQTAFVDVGAKDPEDTAILSVEVLPPVVAAGNPVEIKVTVRAAGKAAENDVVCSFDKEPDAKAERREIKVPAGRSKSYTFVRPTTEESAATAIPGAPLKPGLHQVTLRLAANDGLPFNNTGYATFAVREGRRVLVVADDPRDARVWSEALNADPAFLAEVKSTKEAADVSFTRYAVVCLLDVANPTSLWQKLLEYVKEGGRLAVVPGGDGWKPEMAAYNDNGDARDLLPARLERVVEVTPENKADTYWAELLPNSTKQHQFLEKFREWRKRADIDFYQEGSLPWANRFWQMKDFKEEEIIVQYAKGDLPALLEKNVGKGRVLLFTTAFDERKRDEKYPWNNYNAGLSFYFVLVNHAVGYLAGDAEAVQFNEVCGRTITVNLPASSRLPLYTLGGPGISTSESTLPRAGDQDKLIIPDAKTGTPGNFTVIVPKKDTTELVGAYSLNCRSEESLLDPVPVEEIEKVLGPGSVVPVGQDRNLREALQGHWNRPLDLLPWLLIAVLLVLAVENLLANRFYRREKPVNAEDAV
jgi:hypothetical protein